MGCWLIPLGREANIQEKNEGTLGSDAQCTLVIVHQLALVWMAVRMSGTKTQSFCAKAGAAGPFLLAVFPQCSWAVLLFVATPLAGRVGLVPTYAGEIYLRTACEILALYHATIDRMRSLEGLRKYRRLFWYKFPVHSVWSWGKVEDMRICYRAYTIF